MTTCSFFGGDCQGGFYGSPASRSVARKEDGSGAGKVRAPWARPEPFFFPVPFLHCIRRLVRRTTADRDFPSVTVPPPPLSSLPPTAL